MAITLTSGQRQRRGGTFQAQDAFTQSTATGLQSLSVTTDISVLGMGTATGFGRNRYLLATTSAVEGQSKVIAATATGEAYVDVGGGTATGGYVFSNVDHNVVLQFLQGKWRQIALMGATFATATNS